MATTAARDLADAGQGTGRETRPAAASAAASVTATSSDVSSRSLSISSASSTRSVETTRARPAQLQRFGNITVVTTDRKARKGKAAKSRRRTDTATATTAARDLADAGQGTDRETRPAAASAAASVTATSSDVSSSSVTQRVACNRNAKKGKAAKSRRRTDTATTAAEDLADAGQGTGRETRPAAASTAASVTATSSDVSSSSLNVSSASSKRKPSVKTSRARFARLQRSKTIMLGAAERKAKKVRLYRDGDAHFAGITYSVSAARHRSLDALLDALTDSVVCDGTTALPHGVRCLFDEDTGRRVQSIDELRDGAGYVCSGRTSYARPGNTRTRAAAGRPPSRSTPCPPRRVNAMITDEEAAESGEACETTETMYTEEELAEYKALFAKFDLDGSESIDTSELGNALRFLGCNPLDSEVEAMIAEADGKSNDNGKLEYLEFCEIIAKNRKSLEQEEQELKDAFQIFDKNGDGTVNREELKETMKSAGMLENMSEEDLDELLHAADTSGNGTIEYNEMIRLIQAIEHS